MSNTFAQIFFSPVVARHDLIDLIQIVNSFPSLSIDKYGDVEPLRQRYDGQSFAVLIDGLAGWNRFYWTSVGNIGGGRLCLQDGKGQQTASLAIWTNAEKLADPHSPANLLREIAKRFGASYGYVHYLSDIEIRLAEGSDTVARLNASDYSLGVTRWQLVRCLPNLYWANIFGSEYASLFGGAEYIRHAPAEIVEELAKDLFWIQLSSDLLDVANHHSTIIEARAKLKPYLGEDCFFDPQAGFDRSYRVPNLGWEEPVRKPISLAALKKAGLVS